MKCIGCGSPDIFALDPGREPLREGPTNVLLDAGAPTVARCKVCTLKRYPLLARSQ